MHAFGHLDLLYPASSITPTRALEIAIEGETYEYTEMYPSFRKTAVDEGNAAAVAEIDEQIAESKEHAEQFGMMLTKAAKRFAALANVEERHANHYKKALEKAKVFAAA
jgi:rubrerythrin